MGNRIKDPRAQLRPQPAQPSRIGEVGAAAGQAMGGAPKPQPAPQPAQQPARGGLAAAAGQAGCGDCDVRARAGDEGEGVRPRARRGGEDAP